MRRDVYQAIADPVRREIIDLLSTKALSVNEVANKFGISRPAISKHLKILHESGLIKINQKGRERYCHIQAQNLIPAFMWLEQHKKLWEERIDSFEEYLMKLKTKKMNDRTVTIRRTFDAPVNLVWKTWTQPEHIAKWWSPKGIKTEIIKYEFIVGGKWKFLMPMPDGKEFIAEGVYTEIVKFEKIISKAAFKPMTEDVEIQALFKENEGKTDFTFNVVHPTVEYRIQQEKMGLLNGWGSVFDRLEVLLESIK